MKFSRIKLQWGASKQQPGQWYLGTVGVYDRKGGSRAKGLAISMLAVCLWMFLLGCIGYFSLAGYYWWKQEQRRYNFVAYTDVLLWPLSADKRREIKELQGKAILAEGMEDLKTGQWNKALMNLRVGLDKYPRDNPARLQLARIFLAYRLRDKAQETLMAGLDYGYPGRAYLESAISLAASGEDYELVIEICDRGFSLMPANASAAERRWLVDQRLKALLAEKRNDDAYAYSEKMAAYMDETVLSEQRLLALLQSRRADEAVTFAEEWRKRDGDTAQVLRLLARAYREAGRNDDMAQVLDELVKKNPADARMRVFAIIQTMLAGNESSGRLMIDDFIFRFGGTPENYVMLAEPLAEIKNRSSLGTVLAAAEERGIRDPRLPMAMLQIMIGEQSWGEANRQLEVVRDLLPPDGVGRASMLELIRLLIAAASDGGEAAQSSLVEYVASRQMPMSAYRQCIDVLRVAGRIETARLVVRSAQGVFPSNRYLADCVAEFDGKIAAAKEAEAAAKAAAKGAPAPAFATAQAFYAALEDREKTGGPEAGVALLRALRSERPAWMASEGEALDLREMQINARTDDVVALQGAVRRYLNTDRIRVQNTLALARSSYDEGRKDHARIILDEVLRRVPDQEVALALKAKWFPPPPKPSEPVAEPAGVAPAEASVPASAQN